MTHEQPLPSLDTSFSIQMLGLSPGQTRLQRWTESLTINPASSPENAPDIAVAV